jgi:hypothetical protein
MSVQDGNPHSHLATDDEIMDENSTSKRTRSKRLLNQTLKHARGMAEMASDASRDMVGIAGLASDAVGLAADAAFNAMDTVVSNAARGVIGAAVFTSDTARDVVSGASETARDISLKMARTFLGNSTLTLPLPEMLLNKQIRQKLISHPDLDDISVECGDDRLNLTIRGHYNRFLYTLKLDFNVLECQINKEKFLRLRQVGESLDLQLRDANVVTNWLARKVSSKAFDLVNSLPIPSLINHIIRNVPGIQQESHRMWYIDLEQAGFIDFLNNRSWMVEKLLSLTDFSVLPGLNILRESKELMQQLVNQFEVRGLRVQPGRLEIQVGIYQG